MKVIGITSTAILSLLLGIAAPAYAQREQRGEKQARPEPQQAQQQRLIAIRISMWRAYPVQPRERLQQRVNRAV
jgi:hypothetical protein